MYPTLFNMNFNDHQLLANLVSIHPLPYFKASPQHYIILVHKFKR
jgi:hypothetical protein